MKTKQLIAAAVLTVLLSLSVFAGDLSMPPAPQPPPDPGLLAKIVKLITG